MKNYKKIIKSKYHENTLNEIKAKAGINRSVVDVKRRNRLSLKYIIPSVMTIALTVFIIVFSITASPNDKSSFLPNENPGAESVTKPQLENGAINDLLENTTNYLAEPIKTFTDSKYAVIVSIYYGVKDDNGQHYILIQYETDNKTNIETRIFEIENLDNDIHLTKSPSLNESVEVTNKVILNFESNLDIVVIQVTINENVYYESFNLDEYYNDLVSS